MIKLPVCPYCNTVFYYSDVVRLSKKKTGECYHCNKKFKVSKWKGRIIFYFIFAVVISLLDVIFLHITDTKTALPIIAFTVICVILSLLFLPYTVRFYKKGELNKKVKR